MVLSATTASVFLITLESKSSSLGRLLARGLLQTRTRRFPLSGSSADVPRGYSPHICTTTRGRGSGKRSLT